MEKNDRKNIRLSGFDYSRNGLYFITICTEKRFSYLSEIIPKEAENANMSGNKNIPGNMCVGDAALGVPQIPENNYTLFDTPQIKLTNIGKLVNINILKINEIYKYVSVKKYVIMPDHIHMILFVSDHDVDNSGTPRAASPTKSIPQIINGLKTITTKRLGFSIWQRAY